MPLVTGTMKDIKLGSTDVQLVMLGNTVVWERENIDYESSYLTLEVVEQINNEPMYFVFWAHSGLGIDVEFSINDGEWKQYSSATTQDRAVSVGDFVRVRGNNSTYYYYSSPNAYRSYIEISGASFNLCGNVMSLIYGDNFYNKKTLTDAACFHGLFRHNDGYLLNANNLCLPATILSESCYSSMFKGCTSLVNAPVLPATNLSGAGGCYSNMFFGCTSLVNAPALPATALAGVCYGSMFEGCTSLVNAPALPATSLGEACYWDMFKDCTSLVNAPALPATALTGGCYIDMFWNCTSLINAPVLPATSLANSCYHSMFWNCTSLVNAPELPAATLEELCYAYMFHNCGNLNYIKCLAIDITAHDSTIGWASGVSRTGTFVKSPNMSSWTTGDDGAPNGWTVIDAT